MDQGRLVDDKPPRSVDQECALFHQRQLARTDLMPRLRVERAVERYEIGFTQKLVERHESQAGFVFLAYRFPAGIPVEHAHSKSIRASRHSLADEPSAADQ